MCWHKLGEVENEYTSKKPVISAIFMPKIFTIPRNLAKLWRKISLHSFFWDTVYRQLIGNHTLAFDWCHFWWPWSTFEGHFSQGCHFHVHFSYPWHAFASHGLPAIAELLVFTVRRYALHGLCDRNSVCLSVYLSHSWTLSVCPHGSTYDHGFFTIW